MIGRTVPCYHRRVDKASLDDLCELARLRLDAGETEAFVQKFEGLLAFVEAIREYEPVSGEPPLTSGERLLPRKDNPQDFAWPRGTRHDYRVPRIINFEGEG